MTEWSAWMIEYARTDDHPASRSLYGTAYDERWYLPFCFVLLEGEGHLALVDTGFDPGSTFIRGFLHESTVSTSRSARHVLGKLGVTPEDVDTVLLTHAHFDHMGNLPVFPNADVWIQRREVEWAEEAVRLPQRFRTLVEALDPSDLLYLTQLEESGRLHLADGVQKDVLPGVDLVPAFETHTEGSQYVVIRAGGESWVMTGDNVYSYRNVEDPSGYFGIGYGNGSLARSLYTIDDIMQVAGTSERLLIPHEGKIFSRFPSVRTEDGLAVAEMRLAPGAASRLPLTG